MRVDCSLEMLEMGRGIISADGMRNEMRCAPREDITTVDNKRGSHKERARARKESARMKAVVRKAGASSSSSSSSSVASGAEGKELESFICCRRLARLPSSFSQSLLIPEIGSAIKGEEAAKDASHSQNLELDV